MTELVLHALDNAVSVQQMEPDLILHMDLGLPYTSKDVGQVLEKQEIILSFSRKGCLYDVFELLTQVQFDS
ncbi:hypothetical protein [Domibacillus aminovorans]|uniref:hypothetical protein n=1 Tax=Domibacillus aminovorans TaxID=29332 RepID=UPI0012FD50E9|nr:hypothetical protein [Domibacillus aminovorans]